MKTSHVVIFIAGIILGVALCWFYGPLILKHLQPRPVARSEKIKIMRDGAEVHTLMLDQYNALIGYLESEGQTNALDLFRQYRCAIGAEMSSSDVADTIRILQYLRRGDNAQNFREANDAQAISLLEQQLCRYSGQMLNCYGGLYPTNRERVNLAPMKQAHDYFEKYPSPTWTTGPGKSVGAVLVSRP